MFKPKKKDNGSTKPVKKQNKILRNIHTVLLSLLVFLGFLAFFSAKWYIDTYGQLGFESILFTLLSNLTGLEATLLFDFFRSAAIPALLLSAVCNLILFMPSKKKFVVTVFRKFKICLFPVKRVIAIPLSILLVVASLTPAAFDVGLFQYLSSVSNSSTFYQDYYEDPEYVPVHFPEKKRNLVYIFLESMENTYFSTAEGGALDVNAMPELYDLANTNLNFSEDNDVGGFFAPPGTTWTIGAIVGQTAGIPLKTPSGIGRNKYGGDGVFLPGVTNITNILHDAGYYQTLMVGSDSSFGGRKEYFLSHDMDHVYDLFTARDAGIVADDYYVWWGMEDKYLFEYARQELTEIAKGDQPFAFSMLTVDTHRTNGYVCSLCSDEQDHQYENVISCSSKQVIEFVQWIQQQDFYENTTVIICGDHPTMDNQYIKDVVGSDFPRRVYNCILNPVATPTMAKNRVFCTLDMFPTTLGALGCTIDGDRLGFGTNLFSNTPTLAEEMGMETLNEELSKSSSFYSANFYTPKKN